MGLTALKILVSACVISYSSYLAGKKPELAGFIIAFPISTMLALAFTYGEYKDPEVTVRFAKSILAAIPVSLLFFVPFLLADKLKLGFWWLYVCGIAFIAAGYFIHQYITSKI